MVTAAGRGRERGSRPCNCPWLGALGWAVGRGRGAGPWTVGRGRGPWAVTAGRGRGPWPRAEGRGPWAVGRGRGSWPWAVGRGRKPWAVAVGPFTSQALDSGLRLRLRYGCGRRYLGVSPCQGKRLLAVIYIPWAITRYRIVHNYL